MKLNASLLVLAFFYMLLIILSVSSETNAQLAHNILFLLVISASLNIVLGFAGLPNLGQVGFLGIGAYTFGVLVSQGLNPYISMILGGVFSSVISLFLGIVVLRFKGPFFVCGTIVLATAMPNLINATGFAGGSHGLSIYIYLTRTYDVGTLICILLVLSIIINIITFKLLRSKFGYSLMSIREDEEAARTLGVNTFKTKLTAFAISAFFPGIAGGVMALRLFLITPSNAFNIMWTIEAILTTLLGGGGSMLGPVIGVFIYQILKDFLMRFLPGLQLLIFSFLVILIILFAPEGLVGTLRNKFKKLENFII